MNIYSKKGRTGNNFPLLKFYNILDHLSATLPLVVVEKLLYNFKEVDKLYSLIERG